MTMQTYDPTDYGPIHRALVDGNIDLADAIAYDTRCPDCGGYINGHGQTVDPDKCCFRCEP